MLHLRKHILSLLRSPSPSPLLNPSLSSLFSLHRLLSTSTATSATGFAIEDYLVTTCHLTPAQALKASKPLSHLKSPSNPNAVLAFLTGLGLTAEQIAAVVAADPRFLCADVQKTLAPRAADLRELGLSHSQIARLVPLARVSFRSRSLGRNLRFWLPIFGCYEKLLRAVQMNSGLLASDLEKVAKPNVALLKKCGLGVRDIANMFGYSSRALTINHKLAQDTVARVRELGIEQRSRMFGHALATISFMSREKLAEKTGVLEKLGWSKADVSLAVRKAPKILSLSEKKMRRIVEFLKGDVGLEIPYIARRPALLMYSLERRLSPRHQLLKVLKAKALLDDDLDFYFAASLGEVKFLYRFVLPYKDRVPGLADAYASACAGKAPMEVVL